MGKQKPALNLVKVEIGLYTSGFARREKQVKEPTKTQTKDHESTKNYHQFVQNYFKTLDNYIKTLKENKTLQALKELKNSPQFTKLFQILSEKHKTDKLYDLKRLYLNLEYLKETIGKLLEKPTETEIPFKKSTNWTQNLQNSVSVISKLSALQKLQFKKLLFETRKTQFF